MTPRYLHEFNQSSSWLRYLILRLSRFFFSSVFDKDGLSFTYINSDSPVGEPLRENF